MLKFLVIYTKNGMKTKILNEFNRLINQMAMKYERRETFCTPGMINTPTLNRPAA